VHSPLTIIILTKKQQYAAHFLWVFLEGKIIIFELLEQPRVGFPSMGRRIYQNVVFPSEHPGLAFAAASVRFRKSGTEASTCIDAR
jgi:hypothetical protein